MAEGTSILAPEAYTDDQWLDMLIAAADAGGPRDPALPLLPNHPLRSGMSGEPAAAALRNASMFYRMVRGYCDALAMPLGPNRRVLDFGVGWGCFPAFLERDVDAANIYGCDFPSGLLAAGTSAAAARWVDRLYPLGRLPYPDGMFDCIIAYSAFMLLPAADHQHWAREIGRVATPGCVVTFRVGSRRALDTTAPDLLRAFDRGEFIHRPGSPGSGDAIVPLPVIRRWWRPPFEVRDTIDEALRFDGVVIIAQHA